ncbi:hypothetical protein BDZ89DRAFT_1127708 [Hymenopellis radicata]|nr:hypothetical protein BDZ89DRAFT_1127708 [Hymenopellis radicata]
MSAPIDNDASSSSRTPKAISSFAKRPSDTTRQGTQKLKFAPTLPPRRKKEEVKTEPAPDGGSVTPSRDRGRGRGRGDGRGRGRGAPRPAIEMTASGPFAMGPAMAGSMAPRRSIPRSNFSTPRPLSTPGSSIQSSLSNTPAPTIKREEDKGKGKAKQEDDEEVYSDPDEGVEIVDMDNVRKMDFMAPESLQRARPPKKVAKEERTVEEGVTSQVLNLSESEDEEELEDMIEDFAAPSAEQDADPNLQQDRLYFFQFPNPFPTFTEKGAAPPPQTKTPKKVSFAVKSEGNSASATPVPDEPAQVIDGMIGHLQVYRSGAVKIQLVNGTLLDVIAGTQPSFLQQAVALDLKEHKMSVLGEVNKRFVVSPDVDSLLQAMEQAENKPKMVIDGEEGLISMDTT